MRRATVLATALLAMGALAAPAMAVAPDDVPAGHAEVDRIDGDTRYDTAAQTALETYPDGAETVLVATGEKFPDALAASYMAGGVDAPIVLVERDDIPSYTADALNELDPSTLVVLGREDAISNETYDELEALEGVDDITRVGGDTRRETAAMIATGSGEAGTMRNLSVDEDDEAEDEGLRTAIVSRADEFPDALASGPLAFEGRHPILLTDTNELPAVTAAALAELEIEQVILTGGPVAISEEVEADIADLDGIENVERVAGDIRTETAVMLGELTRAELGWDGTNISLARGDNFPDALTLAPLAAEQDASLFLSRNPETIEGHTFAGIQELCEETENLLISGGPVAISAEAQGEAMLATICADYVFPISWEQEVEDGKVGAEGTGWVTIEGDTICTVYDVRGLEGEANASHIHEGEEGEAPADNVVLDLGAPNAEGFLATCETDQTELAAEIRLTPENYYVNIHTPDFPLGAARGQLPANEVPDPEFTSESMVFGDAVSEDEGTGIDDLVGNAAFSTNEEGQVCLDLTFENLDPGVTVAEAAIYQGAADEDAAEDALATFEDPTATEEPVCSEDTDLVELLLASQDPLYLSVTNDSDEEIARGQLESTHDAELIDPDADEGDDPVGAAFLYEASADTTMCAAVVVDPDTFTLDGSITVVNDEGPTTIASYDATTDGTSVFFDCTEVETDTEELEPETITVDVDERVEDLVGDFTEEETPEV